MKISRRPCTPVQLIRTRSLLESAGYQTVQKGNVSVTFPPGRRYDEVAFLFSQGASLDYALKLSLVSPAGMIEAGQGIIVIRDAADFGHRDRKIGEMMLEETKRGPQRSDPDEEIAASLPTHFRICLPQIDEV